MFFRVTFDYGLSKVLYLPQNIFHPVGNNFACRCTRDNSYRTTLSVVSPKIKKDILYIYVCHSKLNNTDKQNQHPVVLVWYGLARFDSTSTIIGY